MNELERFCKFCRDILTTEQGRPLVIEPFQKQILADFFADTREVIVICGKKNGKTSALAALALYHLLTEPFADVAIVAASRDQARKLLDQLIGYVRRSSSLRSRLRITQREVRYERQGGIVRVLASDSDTLDGWGGTLALVDELGRHKTEENFGLLRDGLGPRSGQLVAISTAGDDEESALGRLRAAAHAMEGFTRDPDNRAHKFVSADGFAFHEWSLDPGDDVNDLELLKLANPASWIDEAELRARRDSPSTQPWQLARFTGGGIWMAGEDSAISGKEWAACADPGCEPPPGAEGVVIGGDLGYTRDCTAFVAAWRSSPDDPVILGLPVILKPPEDGTSIDIEDMVMACREFAERWPKCSFAFDAKAGGVQLLQRLEREIPESEHIAYEQYPSRLCGASMGFAELVSTGKLRHPDDPELTDHVLAGAARFAERWRFVKPKGKNKWIDGLTAAMIAVDMATSIEPKRRSVYEERGVLAVGLPGD